MRFVRSMIRSIERNRRLHEDADFMVEVETATRLEARWSANILLYTITLFFVLFVTWASLAEVEQLTRGMGKVVPSSQTQLVQSLEGGILAELLVQEGAIVKKDQVLARVRNVAFASEEKGIEAKAAALRLKRDRLSAQSSGTEFVPDTETQKKYPALVANEVALHQSRKRDVTNAFDLLDDKIRQAEASLREIKAQISRLSESKNLLQKEVTMVQKMVAQNAAPRMEAIKLEREIADVRGNLNVAVQKRGAVEAELSVSKRERTEKENKFKSEALSQISEVEAELAGLRETLVTASDRVDRSELRAPSSGIVKTIHLDTIGGIVEPAKVLMEIVPTDDDLQVTANVSPTDIAFLNIGQDVKVKVTAYDAQRYGSLEGRLTRIGADTITDKKGNVFFEVDVVTDKNYLGTKDNPLPIIPGMVAQIDVITGKRTIMSYLMKPFLRARQEALTER